MAVGSCDLLGGMATLPANNQPEAKTDQKAKQRPITQDDCQQLEKVVVAAPRCAILAGKETSPCGQGA
jgi:hypothetical protein